MARRHHNQSVLDKYGNLNTLSAVAGFVSTVAAAYVYDVMVFEFPLIDYQPEPLHMMLLTMLALMIALGASKTRAFDDYGDVEKVVVAFSVAVLVSQEFSAYVADLVFSDPLVQLGMFIITVVTWVVVAR